MLKIPFDSPPRQQKKIPATYHGQPALKASPWDRLVPTYIFLTGTAGAAQVLSLFAYLRGGKERESVIRNGRFLAVFGTLAGTPMLIADLKTPKRWYNMLRIFRGTSPMSIGSYLLTGFGGFASLAALGYLVPSRRRLGRMVRCLADLAQWPAAAIGAGMSSYTAALLSSTSTPLWAAAPKFLAARFAASSIASGAAALSLAERVAGNPKNCRELDRIACAASTAGLATAVASDTAYKRAGVDAPLTQTRARKHVVGTYILSHALPMACHAINFASERPSRGLSILASASILAGSLSTRISLVEAGIDSTKRPVDSLQFVRGKGRRSGQ